MSAVLGMMIVWGGALFAADEVKWQPTNLERFLDGVFQYQISTQQIPGAVVSVVRDGEVLVTKGYGFADVDAGRPMDPSNTLVEIGSVSKIFTGVALMQLVEAGLIDLDVDIYELAEKYDIPIQPRGKVDTVLTLRQLLSHSGGVEPTPTGSFFEKPQTPETALRDWVVSEAPIRVRPSSEAVAYTNWGPAFAGLLIEAISGKPYADYLEENIFNPLGMHLSTARDVDAHSNPNMSNGYANTNRVMSAQGRTYLDRVAPSGGIRSTAVEMALFLRALMGSSPTSESVVSDESLNELRRTAFARRAATAPGIGIGQFQWIENGVLISGHTGGTKNFITLAVTIPQERTALYATYNSRIHPRSFSDLLTTFMDEYFPPESSLGRPTSIAPMNAKQYVGIYRSSNAPMVGPLKAGLLFSGDTVVSLGDQGVLRFDVPLFGMKFSAVETSSDVFTELNNKFKIHFYRNEKGVIAGFSPGYYALDQQVRIAPYRGVPINRILLGAGVIISLILIGHAFVAWANRKKASDIAKKYWVPVWAAASCNLVFVVFFPALLIALRSDFRTAYTPPLIDVLLILPIISVMMSVTAFLLFVRISLNSTIRLSSRGFYFLAAVSSFVFLAPIANFNLLTLPF